MNGKPHLHSKHSSHLVCQKKVRTNMAGLDEYLKYLFGTQEAIPTDERSFFKAFRRGVSVIEDPHFWDKLAT